MSIRNVYLLFAWVLFAAGLSLSGLSLFHIRQFQSNPSAIAVQTPETSGVIAVPAPEEEPADLQASIIEVEDGRAIAVRRFIERYNPKLLEEDDDFHQDLVAIADEHGIDFRLLPAIAMKESGMCRVIPEGSYNCLGLGVHSRGTWHFPSYRDNFAKAAEILKKNYIDIGLVTPEQIMTKYTPSSPDGIWAKGVNQFMTEMRYDDRSKGIEDRETNNVLELAQ